MTPNFIDSITSGISDLAISTLPAIGGAIGEVALPGIGGELGAMAGTMVGNALNAPASDSDAGMLGAPALAPVARTIVSFEGEEAAQQVTAAVTPVSQQTESIESLKHFFQRPRRLDTMPLAFKSAWIFPSEYFSSAPVAEKLKSYSGARYTLCVRVTSNSQPLCNGAYVIGYCPNDVFCNAGVNEFINRAANAALGDLPNLVQYFHGPHVVHDISQTSSTEFRVPFWQPLRFIDTGTMLGVNSASMQSDDVLGRITITNIGKILGTDNQVVEGEMTVWMWLEDLELFYPTDFNAIHSKNSYVPPTRFVAQGPEHHSHMQRSQVVMQRANNTYVDDVAHPPGVAKPMSVTSSLVDVVGAASDDMLDYFKIPSFLGSTSASGSGLIWVRPYTSCNITKTVPSISPPLLMPPPTKLAVSTDLYQFWRGSINYRFNFIASKFHSGRIQFGFVPHVALTSVPTSEDLWSNINSSVLDLREQHSIEINCPFRLALNHAYRTDCSGTLIYRNISPLVGPEGTSAKVVSYVETWAGDDFEVTRYNPAQGGLKWPANGTTAKGVTYRTEDYEGTVALVPIPPPPVTEKFVAQGPAIGEAVPETIRDTVNDAQITWSQALAALQPIPSDITLGVQKCFIGADNDYLISGWTVPRAAQQSEDACANPLLTPIEKLRTLFYGIHHDMYIYKLPTAQDKVRYGVTAAVDNVVFPYQSNAQYYGPGSVLRRDGGSVPVTYPTVFGPTGAAIVSLPNARVFYPWMTPVINAISDPREPARLAGRLPNRSSAMKGKSM